jgi:hypothetical protein
MEGELVKRVVRLTKEQQSTMVAETGINTSQSQAHC